MANGTLTRQEMEQVIREGGSVLHGGRTIMRVEDLPTDAQLAGDDPARQSAAAADLQSQIERLQADLQALQANQTPVAEVVDPTIEQEPGTGKVSRKRAPSPAEVTTGASGDPSGSGSGSGEQTPPSEGGQTSTT